MAAPMLTILLLLWLSSSASRATAIQCLLNERNSLLDFKAAVVDYDKRLDSWQGFNCCTWDGVGCDFRRGHVTLLDLSGYTLEGNISSSLFQLARLEHLNLVGNNLQGNLSNIPKLKRLTFLALSSNDEMNPLFVSLANLSNLTNLEYLSLSGVDISSMKAEEWGEAVGRLSGLTELSMFDCGLRGPIPSAIGNMSSLESLSLSDSNIEGLIPPSIGNLSKLVYLDLSHNKLSGVIPPSLGSLSSLASLYLDGNQLNGSIPSSLSELVRLKYLFLESNRLNDATSLSFFDSLTKLEELHLSDNHLTVSINSTWIPRFENLVSLSLASCNLAEFPTFLVTQSHLESLDLSSNSITGNIPTWIWNSPSLSDLFLADNQFTGLLPSRLTSENLENVDLHNNKLEGALPFLPPGVLYLDLSMNQFNGSIPSNIVASVWDTFYFLSLSRNNLSGTIPDSLCNSGIGMLDLSKNMLRNTIPPNFLRNCSKLRVLNFAENNLEGEIPKEWGNLDMLHTLNLNGNQLQGVIPSSIAKCYDLTVLDLGNNNLEGTIPHWIGNLSQLKILMLRSNKFQGNIPSEIIGLPNLQILDLSHNRLSGFIPSNLTNLLEMANASQSSSHYLQDNTFLIPYKNQIRFSTKGQYLDFEIILSILKCIDLSSNNLSGGIPPKMGSLQGLKALNLSRNHLSGKIPKTLGGMVQLESLDLSINRLNGTIPLELEALFYLQVLNLSYNMLDGNVPIGGQFLSFLEPSYLGNVNLSGIPFSNTTCRYFGHGQRKCTNEDTGVDEADDPKDGEITWWTWAMAVGLSYGVGFSIVIGLLTFNNRFKKTMFNFYDGIILGMLQRG